MFNRKDYVSDKDWPLSRKFGCHPDMAYDLLVMARDLGAYALRNKFSRGKPAARHRSVE